MVLTDRLLTARRAGNPSWRAVLVLEILAAEDRFEHALLVAHDQLVLEREQKHRKGQEPEHARDRYESHPDQKISHVQWISDPGKYSVRDESLHVARASACHGAGGRDARETNAFTDHDEREANFPAKRRSRSR